MRRYARDETDGRMLLWRLECDAAGCEEHISPHPRIRWSGWTKVVRYERGEVFDWHYCPEHADCRTQDIANTETKETPDDGGV